MASLVSNSYSKKLLRLISWSHWFTFFNIFAAIFIASIYVFTEPTPQTTFGVVYLITTWFSHMAFLTFVGFVLIVFPITVLFPYTRLIRGFASLVFTLILVVLVLDGFTYRALGYHLNASSSEQILELITNAIEKDSTGFWLTTTIVSCLILAFELVVSNYSWKHIHQLQQTIFAKYVMLLLVTAFIFSHVSHIWADANLEYDVLKQDTLFPLSYPATAKTLLTKYELFDPKSYLESKTAPLSFNNDVASYPTISAYSPNKIINNSTFIVLNRNSISRDQINLFAQRSSTDIVRLTQHIDNASTDDAWFNFFYGLPSIYQAAILKQNKKPLSFQLLEQLGFDKNITVIATDPENTAIPQWLLNSFTTETQLSNAVELIFGEHFQHLKTGLHVYYFANEDDDQLELFVDALLLAQQKKIQKDIIWISALGNNKELNQLAIKPALLIWPNNQKSKLRVLTSQMDIQATLITNWLGYDLPAKHYSTGDDILALNKNRIIANSTENGLMIFEKDKSIIVDQLGNFQGYSRQLNEPISIKPDYPLMINGVHFIKKYIGEVE